MKDRFIKLLLSTNIEGMDSLVEMLELGGFFTAPCSSKFHLSQEGGLLEHSLNVYDTLCKLNESMDADLDHDDIVVCALLHDLGKMGDRFKPYYIVNYVNSKTKNKETGEYDKVVSTAQPYKANPELTYQEHEIRSTNIAERYIYLTEAQENAILHHNGLYGKLDSLYGNQNYLRDRLSYLLHVADMYCSRFTENKEGDEA